MYYSLFIENYVGFDICIVIVDWYCKMHTIKQVLCPTKGSRVCKTGKY